jgi:hypothetical protein
MNTPNIDLLLSDITFRRGWLESILEVTVHDGDDTRFDAVSIVDLIHEIRALRQQRDEARRDVERLDWLGKQMDGVHVEAGVAGGEYQMSWFATVYTFCDEFRAGTVREAIDKAMNHARTVTLNGGRRYGKADAARSASLTQGDA